MPALALLLLAAGRAAGRRPLMAGTLAGVAFCCRPDAALGAAARRALAAVHETPVAARRSGQIAVSLTAGVGAAVVLMALGASGSRGGKPGVIGASSRTVARGSGFVRTHPPEADIAFDEVGILGYYSDRRIVDLIGLVTPRCRPYAAVGDPLGLSS